MKFSVKLSAIVFFIATSFLLSQQAVEQKYRLAQSYENNGNLENAGRLYKELHNNVPMSDEYFDSYVRVYKSLNKFSELIVDAKIQAERKPLVKNIALVAELFWQIGKADSANIYWDKSIEIAKEPLEFIDISQSQVHLRQFEKAIETLLAGRNKINSNLAFSNELSRMYIAIGDYKNGIKEIINHFYERKNTGLAQGRIYALLEIKGSLEYVREYLQKKVSKDSQNLLLLELYSAFLREIDNYQEALAIVKEIDKLKNAQGRDILNFARIAADESNYEIAIEAYKLIIDEGKNNRYTPNALIGMTDALERSFKNNEKFTDKQAQEIIKSYRKIIVDYPNSSHAQQAGFKISSIAFERLNNLEMAIEELQKTIKMNPRSNFALESSILIAKIYITQQELLKAKDILTQIANGRIGNGNEDMKMQALYFLGEIQFFKGNFDAAMKFYTDIIGKSDSYMANDALFKSGLIQTNKENVKAMNLFAEASYADFRNDTVDAKKKYQKVIEETPYSQLAEISLLNSSEIYYSNNNYLKAREGYQKLLNDFPESIYNEKAYFKTALTFMKEGDDDQAIKYFKEILVKFPNSIYLQDSRDNIRMLRGEEI